MLFSIFINNEHDQDGKNDRGLNEDKVLDKKKLKEMTFWVVGRRKLRRLHSNAEWLIEGDFFICFNDSLEQVLVEMAFDICFSKLAI